MAADSISGRCRGVRAKPDSALTRRLAAEIPQQLRGGKLCEGKMPLAGGGRHAAASHAATRRASRESRATAFSSNDRAEHGERSKWLTAKAATSAVAAVATVGSGTAAAEASNPPLLDARARNLSREAAMGDAPIRESTTPSTDGSPRKRSSVQALRERVKRRR